ncbi:MAG: hypothetical protein ABEJ85_05625 [Haloarculaceae archaeon]
MTSQRQAFEMILALVLAILIAGALYPFVPTHVSATSGGFVAAMYFFSRYPWGGRPELNDQLDAVLERYIEF